VRAGGRYREAPRRWWVRGGSGTVPRRGSKKARAIALRAGSTGTSPPPPPVLVLPASAYTSPDPAFYGTGLAAGPALSTSYEDTPRHVNNCTLYRIVLHS
jgi:hypothetical protein